MRIATRCLAYIFSLKCLLVRCCVYAFIIEEPIYLPTCLQMLVVGCWLLLVACWLLAAGCYLLPVHLFICPPVYLCLLCKCVSIESDSTHQLSSCENGYSCCMKDIGYKLIAHDSSQLVHPIIIFTIYLSTR